jgi:hypothetical protein
VDTYCPCDRVSLCSPGWPPTRHSSASASSSCPSPTATVDIFKQQCNPLQKPQQSYPRGIVSKSKKAPWKMLGYPAGPSPEHGGDVETRGPCPQHLRNHRAASALRSAQTWGRGRGGKGLTLAGSLSTVVFPGLVKSRVVWAWGGASTTQAEPNGGVPKSC